MFFCPRYAKADPAPITLKSLDRGSKILIIIPEGFFISILLFEDFLMMVPSLKEILVSLFEKVVKIVESSRIYTFLSVSIRLSTLNYFSPYLPSHDTLLSFM